MSSSSIEVMGREDMQLMLIESEASTSQMETNEEYQQDEMDESAMVMGEMEDELGPPPGSIIFSPQDSLSMSRPASNKGRKKGSYSRRGAALTIKMEEGVDYSKINLPVACEICGKLMANGRILVQHMATHSVNKAFQCPHCPKSFTRMVHLQGHLVFHGIQKQFECPVCHQRFSRQDCVRVHMRLHDKSKCVFCSVCHKAFLTVGALNIHMRIHRGEKPFKCHLCGKCFTQKNHVITHIKRHTKVSDAPFQKKLGPRMFQCEHCPRSFIRLSDYERHVQWNHGAVSDTNMMSKTPGESLGINTENMAVNTSLDDFLMNEMTLDTKVRKKAIGVPGGPPLRRAMCSIGTQTDEDGGHVIIPRKYQSAMTSSSTQMSAPPTPRHEEDLYENDIYDEGMDRNYSSDEDEVLDMPEDGVKREIIPVASTSTQETGSTANDEAFDAVLGKTKVNSGKKNEMSPRTSPLLQNNVVQSLSSNEEDKEDDPPLLEEQLEETATEEDSAQRDSSEATKIISAPHKQVNSPEPIKTESSKSITFTRPISKPSILKSPLKAPMRSLIYSDDSDMQEHDPMIREEVVKIDEPKKKVPHFARPAPVKILDTFNTKNWRGRGRGRGRTRTKGIIGLTGATHLRLIRKSMMNFITEKTEQLNESIRKGEDLPATETTERKSEKRQGKPKAHSKDYVCNNKLCEVCNPKIKSDQTSVEEKMDTSLSLKKEKKSPVVAKDQSAKLLQFLVSGDAKNLHGTDFRLLSDAKLGKLPSNEELEMAIDISMENPSVALGTPTSSQSAEAITNLRQRAEFFSATNMVDDDYVSPPVELQSFCIPTYSCKLCGREFRFEGKLHRHIEAVHQKKEIFSPDVKPGRGSCKYNEREMTFAQHSISLESMRELNNEIPLSPTKPQTPQNPEIEALRSEWDDEGETEMFGPDRKPILPTTAAAVAAMTVREQQKVEVKVSAPVVVTKDIVATTTTFSDVFLGGVKLNINKLSGLADFDQMRRRPSDITVNSVPQPYIMTSTPTTVVKEIVPDTLDTKCQKLLQKLFDNNLLITCGLYHEHVSAVLGKILQHYGVKMIEDYGQGQYEVLKYNLWRLIEWKVTMEQMEEFYTDGKTVEEMMDDIMNGRVPIIAHHEVLENASQQQQQVEQQSPSEASDHQAGTVETVQLSSDNQLMLSQVANVLSNQLNLGDGVTQVVLAQDVSPEMLQGAHIVTIDPTTGQVLSQVTADQVILSDELGQQIQTIDGQVVVSQPSGAVTSLPPGSIVTTNITDTNQQR